MLSLFAIKNENRNKSVNHMLLFPTSTLCYQTKAEILIEKEKENMPETRVIIS